jgi:hypothetical protein
MKNLINDLNKDKEILKTVIKILMIHSKNRLFEVTELLVNAVNDKDRVDHKGIDYLSICGDLYPITFDCTCLMRKLNEKTQMLTVLLYNHTKNKKGLKRVNKKSKQ